MYLCYALIGLILKMEEEELGDIVGLYDEGLLTDADEIERGAAIM